MFAVKGWNLDAASLKPQTEAPKPAKSTGENGEKSKKRKRNPHAAKSGSASTTGPNSDDVGKLWDEHIEGKAVVKSKSAEKKDRKRRKLEKEYQKEFEGVKDLPNGLDKPKGLRVIERPEDIVLGTRAERRGKKVKKSNSDAVSDEVVDEQSATPAEGMEKTAPSAKAKKTTNSAEDVPPAAPPLPVTAKLTPMQSAMRQKLVSARFRHLNQTLYTAPSDEALKLFDQDPAMFEDYHAGFRQQVQVWPQNPVDSFIATVRERGALKQQSQKKAFKNKPRKIDNPEPAPDGDNTIVQALPRTHGTAIIADLGCGDARLASTLTSTNETSKLNLKLHSFDLSAPNKHITRSDISNLPLPDGSVDVAIFCLALMGTNWISFIEEAYRILHWKGELWIAEIKSRFGRVGKGGRVVEHSVGSKRKAKMLAPVLKKRQAEEEEATEELALRTEVDGVETKQEETDVSAFIAVLQRRGFVLRDGEKSIDISNKMFVRMEFVKAAAPAKGKGVNEAQAHGDGEQAGSTWKPKAKKPKFLDEAQREDMASEDEAKVLKPCLYKIR